MLDLIRMLGFFQRNVAKLWARFQFSLMFCLMRRWRLRFGDWASDEENKATSCFAFPYFLWVVQSLPASNAADSDVLQTVPGRILRHRGS